MSSSVLQEVGHLVRDFPLDPAHATYTPNSSSKHMAETRARFVIGFLRPRRCECKRRSYRWRGYSFGYSQPCGVTLTDDRPTRKILKM